MFDSGSITPIPLDPEKLAAFIKTIPKEVAEQFVKNWRRKVDALEGEHDDNRILDKLLRRLETEE